MSVRDLFQKYQEPYFRQQELEEFDRLLKTGYDLIAVGGGAPLKKNPDSYTLVWLRPPVWVVRKRLDLSAPYLKGKDLDSWIYQREKTYADKAQIEVELSGEDLEVDTARLWEVIHLATISV